MRNTIVSILLFGLLFLEFKVIDWVEPLLTSNSIQCIDQVNIYLDALGGAKIEAEMFVAGCTDCGVEIVNGPFPDSVVCQQADKILAVIVTNHTTSESLICNARVIDLQKPIFISCPDTALLIEVPSLITDMAAFGVEVTDNCEVDTAFGLICDAEHLGCGDTTYVLKVLWTIKDIYNNQDTCTQYIYTLRGSLNDVVFPEDDTISCDSFTSNYQLPSPTFTGGLSIEHLSGIIEGSPVLIDSIYFCAGHRIYVYEYKVLDVCSTQSVKDTFNLTVIDSIGPIANCITGDTLLVDTSTCLAVVNFDYHEIMVDSNACSGEVHFRYMFDDWVYNANDTLLLGVGEYEFDLIAFDDCWKSDTCSFTVIIRSEARPGLICQYDECLPFIYNEVFGNDMNDCDTVTYTPDINTLPQFIGKCCGIDSIYMDTIFNPDNCFLYNSSIGDTVMLRWWAVDSCGNISDTCVLQLCVQQGSFPPPNKANDNNPGETIVSFTQLLEFSDSKLGTMEIEAFSIDGKRYDTFNGDFKRATIQEMMQTLPPGIWFLRINQKQTIKWVKF